MRTIDRRVRRTEKQLEDGLILLMQKKSIKNITVRELTALVDINRSTFYLHYKDIYDMVEKLEHRLISEFLNELGKEPKQIDVGQELYRFFRVILHCIEKNAALVQMLWSENGDIAFVKTLEGMIFHQAEQWIQERVGSRVGPQEINLICSYLVTGCLGMLQTWLIAPNSLPPEEMSELMFQLVRASVREVNAGF